MRVIIGINLKLILVLVKKMVLLMAVANFLVVSDQHVIMGPLMVSVVVAVLIDRWIHRVPIRPTVVQVGVAQPRLRVDNGVVLGDGLVVVVQSTVLGRRRSLFGGVEIRLFVVVVGVVRELGGVGGNVTRVVVVVRVRRVVSPMLTVMAVHTNVHHHHFAHQVSTAQKHVTWQDRLHGPLDCLCWQRRAAYCDVCQGAGPARATGAGPIGERPHGDDLMLREGLVWIQPSLCSFTLEHFNPGECYKCQLLCVT